MNTKNAILTLLCAPNKINKHFIGNKDGSVTKRFPAQPYNRGTSYNNIEILSLQHLYELYLNVNSNQMSFLGNPKFIEDGKVIFFDANETIPYGTKESPTGISREAKNWGFNPDRKVIVSIDFDHLPLETNLNEFTSKWMQEHVNGDVSYFAMLSSSSGIYHTITNKLVKEEKGCRLCFLAESGDLHGEFYDSWVNYENTTYTNLHYLTNSKSNKPNANLKYSMDMSFDKQPARNNYHYGWLEGYLAYGKEEAFIYNGTIEVATRENVLTFSSEEIAMGKENLRKSEETIKLSDEYNRKYDENFKIFKEKPHNVKKSLEVLKKEFSELKQGELYFWDILVDANGNEYTCEEIYKDVIENENDSEFVRGDNTWCQPGEPEYGVCADVTYKKKQVRVHSFGHSGQEWYIIPNVIDLRTTETPEIIELITDINSELSLNDLTDAQGNSFTPTVTTHYIEDYKSFEDYIDQNPITNKEILIQAQPTGGFKTTNAYKTFGKYKMVGVSPRISLVDDICTKYKVKNYTADVDNIKAIKSSFVTTINSLHKFKTIQNNYEYLFMDELSMSLPTIFGNTIKNNRECFKDFKSWVTNTKVIAADAYATEGDLKLLGTIANKNIRVLNNRVRKTRGINVNIHKEENTIDRSLHNDIKKNNSLVYIYCSFKKNAYAMKEILRKKYPNKIIDIYTGDHNEEDFSRIMNDLNNECKTDIVIVTPAVSTGVSIVIPSNKEAYVYGYGDSRIDTVDSLLQAINRIRNAKEVHIKFNLNKKAKKVKDFDTIVNDLVEKMYAVSSETVSKDLLLEAVKKSFTKENSYNVAFIDNQVNEYERSNKSQEDLINQLTVNGYDVIVNSEEISKEANIAIKAEMKAMKAELKEIMIDNALKADISEILEYTDCTNASERLKFTAQQVFRVVEGYQVDEFMITSLLSGDEKQRREDSKLFIEGDASKIKAIAANKNKVGKLNSTNIARNTLILTISNILGDFKYEADGSMDEYVISEDDLKKFIKFNDTNLKLIKSKGLKAYKCGDRENTVMIALNQMLSNFNMFCFIDKGDWIIKLKPMFNEANKRWKQFPMLTRGNSAVEIDITKLLDNLNQN